MCHLPVAMLGLTACTASFTQNTDVFVISFYRFDYKLSVPWSCIVFFCFMGYYQPLIHSTPPQPWASSFYFHKQEYVNVLECTTSGVARWLSWFQYIFAWYSLLLNVWKEDVYNQHFVIHNFYNRLELWTKPIHSTIMFVLRGFFFFLILLPAW